MEAAEAQAIRRAKPDFGEDEARADSSRNARISMSVMAMDGEDGCTLRHAARRAASGDHDAALFVDGRGDGWSPGTFLLFDPDAVFEFDGTSGRGRRGPDRDPFELLEDAVLGRPDLVWAGYLSYDAGRFVEKVPDIARADTGLPLLCFVGYKRAWVLAPRSSTAGSLAERGSLLGSAVANRDDPGIERSLDKAEYCEAVRRAIAKIREGEFFQVNLAHRTSRPTDETEGRCEAVARRFVALVSALLPPHGALLTCRSHHVLSASPETFLRIAGRKVVSLPMKGTRPRGRSLSEDEALACSLHTSPKDRAENLMIVDLIRNDLGKVAEYGSVRVPALYRVHSYTTVHQMVSEISCVLRPEVGLADLLRAVFPGGSVTGAPKPAAMNFIESVERVRRSVYTGAIGYFDPSGKLSSGGESLLFGSVSASAKAPVEESDSPKRKRLRLESAARNPVSFGPPTGGSSSGPAGSVDRVPTEVVRRHVVHGGLHDRFIGELAVAIRTLVKTPSRWDLWVGAGIVADSDPEAEWQETLDKANGLFSVLDAGQ